MSPIPLYKIHRHYKGGIYLPTSIVEHHETRRPMVVYTCRSGERNGTLNVRPLDGHFVTQQSDVAYTVDSDRDGWFDTVLWPDGKKRARFALDSPELAALFPDAVPSVLII